MKKANGTALSKAHEFHLNQKNRRLKVSLLIVMVAMVISFIGELIFTPLDAVEGAIVFCFLFLAVMYHWVHTDTANIIIGLSMWQVTILVSFVAWHEQGLYDEVLIALPCIIMMAMTLGPKTLWLPLYIYSQAIILFLLAAHYFGYVFHFEMSNDYIASTLFIRGFNLSMIITFFAATSYFFAADMQVILKRFNRRIKRLKGQIRRTNALVNFDQLTMLPNNRICHQDLLQHLIEIEGTDEMLAFVSIDVQNLRTINNALGHDVGNHLLTQFADRLSTLKKQHENLYLLRGNEFVFLKVASDHQQLIGFQEQILQTVHRGFHIDNYDLDLVISIGTSVAPFDGSSFEQLQKKSHRALSHASKKGGNCALFYDQDLASTEAQKFKLIKALKHAVAMGELMVYYQPKVDLTTEKIVGAEALVRWNSKSYGTVSPDIFIPLAEEIGLITDITKWVLTQACNTCAQWQNDNGQDNNSTSYSIAVNLSLHDFRRGNLPTTVKQILKQSGLPAHLLELEITESVMADDLDNIRNQMRQIQALGVSFAIDDFGTGYSNLSYLSQFNIATLKIDRSFIGALLGSEQDLQIVKAIINMSRGLGANVVAEGIEETEIYQKLALLKCQYGQGYLWSKPVDQYAFVKLLKLPSVTKSELSSLEP